MTKPADPREPGARDIPAELLRGKEEPGGEEPEPIVWAVPPSTQQPPAQHAGTALRPMNRGDWVFVAGLIAVVGGGGALYLFRSEIAAQYELRFHPARYWASEVKSRHFSVRLWELNHQECMVELLGARMKESINIERQKIFGLDKAKAQALATSETTGRAQVCDTFADLVRRERGDLATAERELARVRAK